MEEQPLGELSWVPHAIDINQPSPARVYDVHLGGAHNFAADRKVAARVTELMPDLPGILRANRSFLRRAVRYCVTQGVTQFLDLGSGIPTAGNVHEVAHAADPRATVAYVDIDPVAIAHAQALLAGDPRVSALEADLRYPDRVLAAPEVRGLLDLDQPVAVLMVAVLHFIPDSDHPGTIVREYLDAVAPGSFLVISHASGDRRSHPDETTPDNVAEASEMYSDSVGGFFLRRRAAIETFFTGTELVDPGLVRVTDWRPDADDYARDPNGYAGVGRKPAGAG